MSLISETKQRVWKVTFYGPGDGKYNAHICWTVIAETMEQAMNSVKSRRPHAVFISVMHQGVVDILD